VYAPNSSKRRKVLTYLCRWLSADGSTLAVGKPKDEALNRNDGSVFVFAVNKTSNDPSGNPHVLLQVLEEGPPIGKGFGKNVALDALGLTLAVAAPDEDRSGSGVNDETKPRGFVSSGCVYVYARASVNDLFVRQAYLKAFPNIDPPPSPSIFGPIPGIYFGGSISLSSDGDVLIVGAPQYPAQFVAGQWKLLGSGCVFTFERTGSVWVQGVLVRPLVEHTLLNFGGQVSVSGDGNMLAVGLMNLLPSCFHN
jgi:hypothetical protein